jgi:AcrR family transcriptional regulator
MRKGEITRAAILDQALHVACHEGIDSVTFGTLAEQMKMSKSGVHSHFGSMGNLQLEVVKAYCFRFEREVFGTAMAMPCGLPRLQAMFATWSRHVSVESGRAALPLSCEADVDGLQMPAKQALVVAVMEWRAQLEWCIKQAVELSHLRFDTDHTLLAHAVFGLILALQHETRFLNNDGAADSAARTIQFLMRSCGAINNDASSPPSPPSPPSHEAMRASVRVPMIKCLTPPYRTKWTGSFDLRSVDKMTPMKSREGDT